MKKLYFARHGQTAANAARVFSGGMTISLNETGQKQAEALGQTVKMLPEAIDVIIASTATRAQQTAQLVAAHLGMARDEIEYDQRIRECDFGAFNGQDFSADLIAERDKNFLIEDNPRGVESITHLLERLTSFKQDIEKRSEDIFLIIGHGFSGRMLIRLFAGIEHTKPIPHFHNADVFQLYPFKQLPKGDLVLL